MPDLIASAKLCALNFLLSLSIGVRLSLPDLEKLWSQIEGDRLPMPLAFLLLVSSVINGKDAAVILLQKAMGVSPDGVLSDGLIDALSAQSDEDAVRRMLLWQIRQANGKAVTPNDKMNAVGTWLDAYAYLIGSGLLDVPALTADDLKYVAAEGIDVEEAMADVKKQADAKTEPVKTEPVKTAATKKASDAKTAANAAATGKADQADKAKEGAKADVDDKADDVKPDVDAEADVGGKKASAKGVADSAKGTADKALGAVK